MPRMSPTTRPGYVNENGQMVVGSTGAASEARSGQAVYRVRCGKCVFEYGVSGIDVEKRLCPKCQGGVEGERLREAGPSLFSDADYVEVS